MDKVLEAIAVTLSLLYTFMYLIGVLPGAFYPAAIGAGIFTFLCYKKEIFAESFLQLFYVVMAGCGIYFFYFGLPVGSWGGLDNLILITASLFAAWGIGTYLKKNTSSKMPFVDSFTTVFSLGATWLMIINIPDCWYYWVVINGASTYLYFKRGLKMGAFLYAIYLLMAIDGCIESITWFKSLAGLFI
jgi:nicotinamide mononucleotide transporter